MTKTFLVKYLILFKVLPIQTPRPMISCLFHHKRGMVLDKLLLHNPDIIHFLSFQFHRKQHTSVILYPYTQYILEYLSHLLNFQFLVVIEVVYYYNNIIVCINLLLNNKKTT